ncbi:hypothetical protein FAZ78_22235 [Cereibacter changlensis]|uniref:Uncharacterized protein n=1 Tax=Cereibacter changlensis TaxID=402884 RepID=A0A4U0YS30_9RHOB|nr:hypothetical protein [Cereibacter changlensis]TKA94455.1 hypothetical protein FAZ78_22235 [Cereibacter changlensis]
MAENASSSASVLERLKAVESDIKQILSILQSKGGGSSGGSGQDREQSTTISQSDWDSLGRKLDQFERGLGAKEKAVLLMVMGAAAATYDRAGLQESPAAGNLASTIKIAGSLDRVSLSDGLKSIGSFTSTQVGGFGSPGGEVQDSVGVGGDFTCVHGDWSKDLGKGAAFEDAMIRGRWNALGNSLGDVAGGGAFGRSGPISGGFG